MRKAVVYLAIFLVSAHTFALQQWSNLNEGINYKLQKQVIIKNSNLTFEKDDYVKILEKVNLDMLNVLLFKVKALSCSDSQQTSSLELYDYKNNENEIITIGIELAKMCELEIFVEKKDLLKLSLFL